MWLTVCTTAASSSKLVQSCRRPEFHLASWGCLKRLMVGVPGHPSHVPASDLVQPQPRANPYVITSAC